MSEIFTTDTPESLLAGIRAVRSSISRGELAVIPTDTVYGIAADAFNPEAVQRLLDAKQRDRNFPPPVLIPNIETLAALAQEVSEPVKALTKAFWPGPLTIIVPAQESLMWDLGNTYGTVALRQPNDAIALAVLSDTGPLAVSSANIHDQPAARNIQEAHEQLQDTVAAYLDAGETSSETPSTIIDATRVDGENPVLTIVRPGAISREEIQKVVSLPIE